MHNIKKKVERVEWWLPGATEWGKWKEVDKRVQGFCDKINKV